MNTFGTLLIIAGVVLALAGWPIAGIGTIIAGLVVRPSRGRLAYIVRR